MLLFGSNNLKPKTLLDRLPLEDRLIIACARQDFNDAHQAIALNFSKNPELDWNIICSTAEAHGLSGLIYSNLQKIVNQIDMPTDVRNRFRKHLTYNFKQKQKRIEKTYEVIRYLNSMDFEVMVIKGAALDLLVYKQAWFIKSEDTDLIFYQYKRRLSQTIQTIHNIRYFIKDFAPYLEFDYFGHHDVNMSGTLSIDFKEIWQDAKLINIKDLQVYVMSPEDMLVTACINCARRRYFNLKTLCDIAEIIKAFPDLRWERFFDKVNRYECVLITYAALYTTEQILGCSYPHNRQVNLKITHFRKAVIQWMFNIEPLIRFSRDQSNINNFLHRRLDFSFILPYATYDFSMTLKNTKKLLRDLIRNTLKVLKLY